MIFLYLVYTLVGYLTKEDENFHQIFSNINVKLLQWHIAMILG
jgi:hypothetical protein